MDEVKGVSNIINLNNTVKNLFIAIFLVFGMFAVVGTSSAMATDGYMVDNYNAPVSGSGLRHAFVPQRDSQTGQVVARVNNWSNSTFNGYICAQERMTNGAMHHIGCIWANLAPARSGGDWAIQFSVPTSYGSSVYYTYQAAPSVWRSVAPVM